MSMRIAINGFGRIGRTFLRVLMTNPEAAKGLEVVAINVGNDDPAAVGHLFTYDTTMGTYRGNVQVTDHQLAIGNHRIRLFSSLSAESLPWQNLGIDWVVDCSGKYTKADDAYQHIAAGSKSVLISAPAEGVDCTIIPGVNEKKYDPKQHHIVSLGSCTTNALLPLLHVLHQQSGIESASAVTVHAYTNTQALLDGGAKNTKDLRRHRAAAVNIVPSSTGAEGLVGEVIPELAGKVSARSVRVPVLNVSFLEISWVSSKGEIKRDMVDGWFDAAAKGPMKQILSVTREQLVSSDFMGDEHSIIYDATLTMANGRQGTIFGWYDNEWGYCCRMRDFLRSTRPA